MIEQYNSLVEIIEHFDVKNKTRFRNEYIVPALKEGAIGRKSLLRSKFAVKIPSISTNGGRGDCGYFLSVVGKTCFP